MPPRPQTLPPAQTSSAREAMQSFYCQLCQKGYSRMNDYEAHLGSYDHSHKQRLKDMKAMVRDPHAAARARKAEARADGVITIKLGDSAAGGSPSGAGLKKGGFKKSGFKSAFVSVDADLTGAPPTEQRQPAALEGDSAAAGQAGARSQLVESDTEDEGYDVYDPRFPTD